MSEARRERDSEPVRGLPLEASWRANSRGSPFLL
ncbi:unnamed protein product [Linum tenue]|uniref:Uncharacterized protein n=1 Tax=Linum tenue TaxID=586396 RepID=A0AAV0M3P0_9ROSI|nr:unnamed protein product [Linum tenue]